MSMRAAVQLYLAQTLALFARTPLIAVAVFRRSLVSSGRRRFLLERAAAIEPKPDFRPVRLAAILPPFLSTLFNTNLIGGLMDAKALATEVAADLGDDISAALQQEQDNPEGHNGATRGLSETLAVASFVASTAQLAIELWRVRQDRALLQLALLEGSPLQPRLNPERRLSIIGRIIDKIIPDSFAASPSLGAHSPRTKVQWLQEWSGFGTRSATPTIIMPFADMDKFIVYEPIQWQSPPNAGSQIPSLITVPRGFVTDLASIPSYFWFALPPSGRYGHAAIIHDWLYYEQLTTRETADRVFEVVMEEMAVAATLRKIMWAAVRLRGGVYWQEIEADKRSGVRRVLKQMPSDPKITWNHWRQQPDVFA